MKPHLYFFTILFSVTLVAFAFISNEPTTGQLSDTNRTVAQNFQASGLVTPKELNNNQAEKLAHNNNKGDDTKSTEISERPTNEEIDSSTNETFDYNAHRPKDTIKLAIEETYNDSTYSTDGVDEDLVGNGKMFTASMENIKSATLGTPIIVNLFGNELEGIVEKNVVTKSRGNTYVKVDLGGSGRYINAYYGDRLVKGKMYTEHGSYIFQHNGEVGFILSIYEYKKLKDALVYD